MKIRSGFVSNSSSSSFIISYDGSKVGKQCECCGIDYPDILRIIGNDEWGSYVIYKDREGLLGLLEEELLYTSKEISKYKSMDPEKVLHSYSYPTSDKGKKTVNITAKHNLDDAKKQSEYYEKQIDKIKNIDESLNVAQINISHHDTYVRNLLDSLDIEIIDVEER